MLLLEHQIYASVKTLRSLFLDGLRIVAKSRSRAYDVRYILFAPVICTGSFASLRCEY